MQARSISPGPEDAALAQAHARLLRDDGLQFDRVNFQPPELPGWLRWFDWVGDLFRFIAPSLKYLFWAGVAVLAALVLYAVVREILRMRGPAARPTPLTATAEPAWRPEAGAARDLLAAADRLAAEGRYAEAAHLLLLRSVEDIQSRRPRALRVSLTTREIATLDALPPDARPAFRQIGQVVERSLFGGAAVGADTFAACRRAYEDFALPRGWAA